jgi:NAD(P)-dependent dehydrogenase (short-subunit alcohol dehydrogenase family)
MSSHGSGQTAIITGAGSGFGLEMARRAAQQGMQLVLVDVQADALARCSAEMQAMGCNVLAQRIDVSQADEMQALADAVFARFGAPHLVFNNAGVAFNGLVWEGTVADWNWVLGVNLWGVIHGVRLFTPMMLKAAQRDPSWRGHIVNTASMAGLGTPPNFGLYNVSKHAVVALSETLYQDLALVTDQIHTSVLCPFFVPTGIHESERNRQADTTTSLTPSQRMGRTAMAQAVSQGTVSAAEVAQSVFDAMREQRFYIFTHPQTLDRVAERMQAIVTQSNPPDPFAHNPALGAQLRVGLR